MIRVILVPGLILLLGLQAVSPRLATAEVPHPADADELLAQGTRLEEQAKYRQQPDLVSSALLAQVPPVGPGVCVYGCDGSPQRPTPSGNEGRDGTRSGQSDGIQLCNEGLRLSRQGRWRESEAYFRRAIPLLPGDPDPYFMLGVVLAQQNRDAEALEAIRAAITLNPRDASVYWNLYIVLAKLERYAEALEALRAAARLNPRSQRYQQTLAEWEAWWEKAEFERAYREGEALLNRFDYVGAEAAFRKAIGLNPSSWGAHYNLGRALFRQGRYPEAVEFLRRATQLGVGSAMAWMVWNYLGAALINVRDYREAEIALRRAIQLNPQEHTNYFNLGLALENQNRPAQAIEAYAHAIRLDATKQRNYDPSARVYQLLIRSAPQSEVEIAFRRTLQETPHDGYLMALLFVGLSHQARYRDAEDILRGWMQANPEDSGAHSILGDLLTKLGRDRDAINAYEQAAKAGDSSAADRLAELLRHQAYTQRPRQYVASGRGFVGGTGWIRGFNVPAGLSERERARAKDVFNELQRLAGKTPDQFMNPDPYNFIIAVATSHSFFADLVRRVIRDEFSSGRTSAEEAILYRSLYGGSPQSGRQFDALDCHSNGAMVCLAAIELRDAKTQHVRLFGPQLSAEALHRWQELIERTPGSFTVELYIVDGDPVPSLSYALEVLFTSPLAAAFRLSAIHPRVMRSEINRIAPGISVKVSDCPSGRTKFLGAVLTASLDKLVDCHDITLYQQFAGQSR